jgi:simple sugar transport system permease protein
MEMLLRFKNEFLVILIAFLGGGILVYITGAPFSLFYRYLVERTFGSYVGIQFLIALTTILVLTGLSACIPFSAGVWNIGGEGQLYMGGLAATALMVGLGVESIVLVIFISMIAGAAYGLIPAVLRFKLDTNEIVTTLLLNFVAGYIVLYAVRVPLRLPEALAPQSPYLPELFSIYHLMIVIVIAITLAYLLMKKTRLGFEIMFVGKNPTAAKYAGINTGLIGITTMVLGGAFAGLAGAIIITSYLSDALMPGFSAMYGYIGIGVAMMARLRINYVPFTALIVSILFVTIKFLHTTTQIPLLFASAVVGLIMILVLSLGRS